MSTDFVFTYNFLHLILQLAFSNLQHLQHKMHSLFLQLNSQSLETCSLQPSEIHFNVLQIRSVCNKQLRQHKMHSLFLRLNPVKFTSMSCKSDGNLQFAMSLTASNLHFATCILQLVFCNLQHLQHEMHSLFLRLNSQSLETCSLQLAAQ